MRGCLPVLTNANGVLVLATVTIPLLFFFEVWLARRLAGDAVAWWWVPLMIPPAVFGGLIAAALIGGILELLEALLLDRRRCPRCGVARW
jgi:hypothetical protein